MTTHCDATQYENCSGNEQMFCKLLPGHEGNHFMASKCPDCAVFVEGAWAVFETRTTCIECAYRKRHPIEECDAWRRRAQAADKILDAAVVDADWRIVERARDVLKDYPYALKHGRLPRVSDVNLDMLLSPGGSNEGLGIHLMAQELRERRDVEKSRTQEAQNQESPAALPKGSGRVGRPVDTSAGASAHRHEEASRAFTPHFCQTCGSSVRVVTGGETSHYEPVECMQEALSHDLAEQRQLRQATITVEIVDEIETMTQVGVRVEHDRFLAIGWVPSDRLRLTTPRCNSSLNGRPGLCVYGTRQCVVHSNRPDNVRKTSG